MADKSDLVHIKRSISKDKRLQKLDTAFTNLPEYNLPARDMYEEIKRIHMTRKTRHLDRESSTFTQDIVDGLMYDQSSRSRLSEILMGCLQAIRNLNRTLESLSGYLQTEYSTLLATIRTKAERTSFIEHHVLSKYYRYVERISRIKEAAELVITDIDKAGFMYRNLIESVKMISNREVM